MQRRTALAALIALSYTFSSTPKSKASMKVSPRFIEQHSSLFFGRGMMGAEAPKITTEQVAAGAANDESVSCTDAAYFIVRGTVVVKHDDGTYGTHLVTNKTGNAINVVPPLRRAITNIERLWYDPAHPGKYAIRHIAERLANATEQSAAMPDGKWVMRPNLASGTPLTGYSASVAYYEPNNIGDGDGAPVRFGPGRSAYVSGFTANNQGCTTESYPTNGISRALVRVLMTSNGAQPATRIRVMNQAGHMIGSKMIPGGAGQRVQQWHTFPVDLRGTAAISVQVLIPEYTPGAWFSVGAIHVFEAPTDDGFVIPRDAKVCVLGDSWVTGDLPRLDGAGNTVGTLEREPLTACLAALLPSAIVVGAGRGGDLLLGDPNYPGSGYLARFDTEVAPQKPNVVVIINGANDGFHPPVTEAWLAGWNTLLGKAAAIGARVVIVGVPALCETETLAPGWSNFAANNNVKALAAAFNDWV